MSEADLPTQPRSGSDPALLPDAARERLIARLTESFARDELSVDEYERRVTLAYDARSPAALDALAADLQAEPVDVQRVGAVATVGTAITSVFSNVVREGPPVVPRQLAVRSWAGNVELDLRDSRFGAGVTEIALDVVLGNVEIELPTDVRVENHTTPLLASFESRARRTAASPAPGTAAGPIVRFTGRVVLGNVSVRGR
jgi:hypothetical protein